ncbi:hydrogen gas-evolving membrane-bound hydrogenase subunit E [Gudongella sp. DL1XJH-153]|uniref:hydrogen gas-evolving membrane-bound hydrogenase subunit E n=1 Tax=Gudongella sp. DL1XJH-153 TaxID=3409804 RepID=UPI003BB6D6FC
MKWEKVFTIILLGALLFVLVASIGELPPMGAADSPSYNDTAYYYVEEGTTDTGSTNLIAAIITDYRAFDTLGEATVLFTGIVGVAALLGLAHPKPRKGGEEEHDG